MFGRKMKKLLCAAGAAMICCTAITACGEKKEEKLSRYGLKSEITATNSSARYVHIGANSALTDLDAEDADLSSLEGRTLNYTSRDFQFDGAPEKSASTEEKFRYKLSIYVTDITELDNIMISINNHDTVLGVAVKRTEKKYDTVIYGTYPNQLTIDDFESISSMDNALKYAMKTAQ